MKKFIEILEEIKQTRKLIKAAEEHETNLLNKYEDINNVENEIIKNSKKINEFKITMKILENNAKVALFYEVLPVALGVLSKYVGKPYGEKTRQKISDEVKDRTNCRFYISCRYSSYCFNIYPENALGNTFDISCGTRYINGQEKPLLINNKIQSVSFDDLELFYISCEYVEDIKKRIDELKTLYNEAVKNKKNLTQYVNSIIT